MTRRPAAALAVVLVAAACTPGGATPTASTTPAAAPSVGEASAAPAASPSMTPTLAPATGRIVYDAGPAGLAIVGLDGTAPVAIPGTKGYAAPTCTADGSRVAFSHNQVYVAGLDGTGLIQLTHLTGVIADVPGFAADGTALAFVTHPPSGDAAMAIELDVMGVDGPAPVAISGATSSGDRPAWRPDGAAITFSSLSGGGLAQVGYPTGTVTQLTTDDDSFAAWSPDGSSLVFERGVVQPDGTEQHHLFLLLANGSVTQITSGPADDEFPAWSPDGAWVAFTRFDGAHPAGLFRVRPDGSDETAIVTSGSASASWPCWIR